MKFQVVVRVHRRVAGRRTPDVEVTLGSGAGNVLPLMFVDGNSPASSKFKVCTLSLCEKTRVRGLGCCWLSAAEQAQAERGGCQGVTPVASYSMCEDQVTPQSHRHLAYPAGDHLR